MLLATGWSHHAGKRHRGGRAYPGHRCPRAGQAAAAVWKDAAGHSLCTMERWDEVMPLTLLPVRISRRPCHGG